MFRMDTISILTQLTSVCGVSGAEESAAKTVSQLLSPYGKTQIDSLGNVLLQTKAVTDRCFCLTLILTRSE